MLMLMLINSIYPRANLVTKVTTAAPWGLSSVNYRTVLVSTMVTLGMAVVHSNIWNQKLRRHVNQMWQSLYAGSQDRLGLLLADDDELW